MTFAAALKLGVTVADAVWTLASKHRRAEAAAKRERRAMEAAIKGDRECDRINREFRNRIMKKTTRIDLTAAGLQHCLDEAQSAIDATEQREQGKPVGITAEGET